ncbi:MAG: hypothetical protein ACJ72W_01280 [Actinoallomurus sp.]
MNIFLWLPMIVILPLTLAVRARRRAETPDPAPDPNGYPESMTAVLPPGDEEYLAWLADHHWPGDEYLDLERGWRAELQSITIEHDEPVCPGCERPGNDVWPCPNCGLLVHSTCGHGMRRRKIAKPYRTRDMGAESVIAEWVCRRCASIVGLDVDRGDEESGHDLHQ